MSDAEVRCWHCGQPAQGYATAGKARLCHPDDGMDCYRLVTVYKHPLTGGDCGVCNPQAVVGAAIVWQYGRYDPDEGRVIPIEGTPRWPSPNHLRRPLLPVGGWRQYQVPPDPDATFDITVTRCVPSEGRHATPHNGPCVLGAWENMRRAWLDSADDAPAERWWPFNG